MHHEEEDLAAALQKQAEEKDESGSVADDDGGQGHSKGQPGELRKRSRSPEGGGVAGSDAKRHKNAYEISRHLCSL